MITAKELAEAFERNWKVVELQVEGLSHAQTLLQPPFRGNCFNWVLGHVLETRNSTLLALGANPLVTGEHAQRYGHGSEPVCGDGPGVVRLEKLLDLLGQSQEIISARMPHLTAADLARVVRDHRGEVTLGQRLFFLYFHDTYHCGQAELLRQLAGTNDQII
jgi:hypothetical protein